MKRTEAELAQRISIAVDKNPKRPLTAAYRAFSQLRDGMTVGEFLALEGKRPTLDENPGWAARELRWCVKKGFIRLEPAAQDGDAEPGKTQASPA